MKYATIAQLFLLAASVEAQQSCNSYHADVARKDPFAVRIVFVGDKFVSGQGTATPASFDAPDALDGTHWGYKGFPYDFGELLKTKKPKQKFEIMNFGGNDYSIKDSFWGTCDYEKSLRSYPDIVVMGFGGSELSDLKSLDDKRVFRNKYIELGKKYLSLPSHPQVFLMTPPALKIDDPVPEPVNDAPIIQNKHFYSSVTVPTELSSVADALGLPAENRIDTFGLFGGASLTDGLDLQNDDKQTPNAAGQAKIAQQLYDTVIKFNNFNNHEELYKIGRKVVQDPNPWGI